jgi:hypothetical protein
MINYSEIESEVFGLKTGRFNADDFNAATLREEILAEKYDLVRIKIPAYFDDINVRLVETDFPFYFAGGIRMLSWKTPECANVFEPINKDLEIELYDGTQTESLEHIIKSSYIFNPLGYYKTPGINQVITKELEAEAMYRYFAKYFNNTAYPDNYIWLMKREGKHIGLCALQFNKGVMGCPLGAVAPEAQSNGIFFDILRYSRHFAWQKGIKEIEAGIRSENLVSQHVFIKQGKLDNAEILNDTVDFVFHVVPMAGKGIK